MLLLVIPGFVRVEQLAAREHDIRVQQQADTAARLDVEAQIVAAMRTQLGCVRNWIRQDTARSQALSPIATQRVEDLFAAFRHALRGEQAAAMRLGRTAIREDARYLRQLRRHPVPRLRLACHLTLPHPGSSGPEPSPTATVTVTAAPATVHATATVTAPARTVTVPGATATRTLTLAPGPPGTVTRTATRTKTATVTVTPSCVVAINGHCLISPATETETDHHGGRP